jgi:hypothetical protein
VAPNEAVVTAKQPFDLFDHEAAFADLEADLLGRYVGFAWGSEICLGRHVALSRGSLVKG